MSEPIQLMGSIFSPYVRKATLFLEEKGIDYKARLGYLPQDKRPEFRAASPLGKIPAMVDGDFGLADSSIICAYVERKFTDTPLYPADPQDYARALFIEEYADTALMSETGGIALQTFIGPLAFKKPTDEAKLAAHMQRLPSRLDYLDELLEENEDRGGSKGCFAGDSISIADITIAAHITCLDLGDVSIDSGIYPRLSAFAETWRSRASYQKLMGLLTEARDRATAQ